METSRLSRTLFKQLSICLLTLSVVALLLAWRLTETSAGISSAESIPPPSHDHSMKMSMNDEPEALKQKKAQEILRSPVWSQFNDALKLRSGSRLEPKSALSSVQNKTLKSLAAQRKELLAALIEVDPKAALEHAISAADHNQLPASIAQDAEQRVDENGDFLVRIVMNHDHQTGEMTGSTVEREVVIGETRYKAFVYGRREGMTTKLDIPLHGIALNGKMAVDESPLRVLEPNEFAANKVEAGKINAESKVALAGNKMMYFAGQAQLDEYVRGEVAWEAKIGPSRPAGATSPETPPALSAWTMGVKKLLFMKVDFSDKPGDPSPDAQSLMDNQVSPFYVSNSYNQTSLQTTVTPLLRMPQPSTSYPSNDLGFITLLTDARAAALAAGYDTNTYDLDLVANTYVFNWGGIAWLGYKGAEINGDISLRVIAHELGHNYGNWHANRWLVTDGNPISPVGSHYEYGDDFDAMGFGGGADRQFNATFKYNLGWLSEAHVQTVTGSGTYRVYAHDLSVTSGIQALRIRPNGGWEKPEYWIEFKQLINSPYPRNGAALRWFLPNSGRATEILDLRPSTLTVEDAPLQIGESFLIPSSHYKVTVLGKGNTTPESLDIRIDNYKNAFDFDGDGIADLSVNRNGTWYLQQSNAGAFAARYGFGTDQIVPGDYDDDGKTDMAIFREGIWHFLRSSAQLAPYQFKFGQAGDIPVPGDYDGDGQTDAAVLRGNVWYIDIIQNGYRLPKVVQFGLPTDKPVTADYDGDGKTDIAVYRSGVWYLIRSSDDSSTAVPFGLPNDLPVPADYDGDGKADFAVFRNGTWFLMQSSDGFKSVNFGISTDKPVPADYDGDGKDDLAVFRQGNWYILGSTAGVKTAQFGQEGDVAVPSAFVR